MRYLLVLDHTLGGTALEWAIKDHALEEGPVAVDIVVPSDHDEQDAARARLEIELPRLRSLGVEASGRVAETSAFDAIRDAADSGHYDGVLIATHVPTVSRWLHLDLPHRVERELKIPVEWMDASTDDSQEDTMIQIELPRAAIEAIDQEGDGQRPWGV
jgi:hypothetical protein